MGGRFILGVRSIDEWMNYKCTAYRRKGFIVSLLMIGIFMY